jgi:hypothetical protein
VEDLHSEGSVKSNNERWPGETRGVAIDDYGEQRRIALDDTTEAIKADVSDAAEAAFLEGYRMGVVAARTTKTPEKELIESVERILKKRKAARS